MASGPASELILFIVAVLVAGSVAGALAYVTNDIAHGINDRGAMLADRLRTDFTIINDPNNIPHSNLSVTPVNYTFYVKNIGKEPIAFNPNAIQVFIDGTIIPPSNLTFFDPFTGDPLTSLQPYSVGAINVTLGKKLVSGQYYTLLVVLENGRERELVFKAP